MVNLHNVRTFKLSKTTVHSILCRYTKTMEPSLSCCLAFVFLPSNNTQVLVFSCCLHFIPYWLYNCVQPRKIKINLELVEKISTLSFSNF